MSGNGAFEDEMAFLNRPTPGDGELAAFAQSLRAALITPPPPAQQAALLPRLAESARAGRAEAGARHRSPAPRRRLRLAAQIAFAAALFPLAGAGLAVAGVKLPGAAQSAYESIGVELPNQTGSAQDQPGAQPGAGHEKGSGGETDPAAGARKNTAAEKGGNGKAKGRPSDPGKPSQPSNGQGSGQGNGGNAPGRAKSGGTAGGSATGKAVGKTDTAPPGQANKPASPGNSGEAKGKSKD